MPPRLHRQLKLPLQGSNLLFQLAVLTVEVRRPHEIVHVFSEDIKCVLQGAFGCIADLHDHGEECGVDAAELVLAAESLEEVSHLLR